MSRYAFYAALALGLGLRIALLAFPGVVDGGEVDVYLADEGIVGLMGMHILEGRELPVFFYGQHYLGALEAYFVALSFSLFGATKAALRAVPFAFSIMLCVLLYRFTYKHYSVAAARWATTIVALGPMYFLQWNIKARGGFVEHLVLLFAIMLVFWRLYLRHDRSPATTFGLGLLCGVALWVNQLVLAYLLVMAALLFLERSDRRGFGLMLAGGALGASLLIGYNVVHPLATAKTLGRKAVVLNRVPVEQRTEHWVARGMGKRLEDLTQGFGKLGLVFGVPPDPQMQRSGLTPEALEGGPLTRLRRWLFLFPLSLFSMALIAARPRRGAAGWEPPGSDHLLFLFAGVTIAVGYVSPRYMLAAYPLGAVLVAVMVGRARDGRARMLKGLVAATLVFNALSWVDADAYRGSDTVVEARNDLLEFLIAQDLGHCYSAGPLYHLVFDTQEKVVLAPLQKDRYPRYGQMVSKQDRICYVFRADQASKRQHVAFLALLDSEQVSFRRASFGVYNVLYQFSPRSAITGQRIERVQHQETASAGISNLMGTEKK